MPDWTFYAITLPIVLGFCLLLAYEQVGRWKERTMPRFYQCGCCGLWHPEAFDGDCRDDDNRYHGGELDELYDYRWEEVEQPA